MAIIEEFVDIHQPPITVITVHEIAPLTEQSVTVPSTLIHADEDDVQEVEFN